MQSTEFLSTLSLRRATVAPLLATGGPRYFYPRSPCGERPNQCKIDKQCSSISIHALLAESDCFFCVKLLLQLIFLSTLSLRRATYWPCVHVVGRSISIHALLAESDTRAEHHASTQQEFLSTLSLRRATLRVLDGSKSSIISIHALLAESDLFFQNQFFIHNLFLSTLSLRRATRAF